MPERVRVRGLYLVCWGRLGSSILGTGMGWLGVGAHTGGDLNDVYLCINFATWCALLRLAGVGRSTLSCNRGMCMLVRVIWCNCACPCVAGVGELLG